MTKDNFRFWCPIEKATEQLVDPTTGEQVMRLGGIASTADKDADNEYLDPNGFDIKPLLESGMVNWHHQAKGQPAAIIGEPTKAEIRKDGLYIETDLYPSSEIARQVWDLANTLDKNSKTRRLGYSIEGKVLKRKSDDKKSPDYNHIVQAVITGVAITHMPKNPKTFANIIKGDIDPEDYEEEEVETEEEKKEEKAMTTENAAAVKRESLLGAPKFLTKGETLDKLFQDIPGISIDKAEQIYQLIKSISMAKERKEVTTEDIQKAYETLGLTPAPETEEVEKGGEAEETEKVEEVEKGGDGAPAEGTEHTETAEEEKEEKEEEEEKEVKKGGNRFDVLEKAIADLGSQNSLYIKALGTMMKGADQRLEKAVQSLELADQKISSMEEIIKGQAETIASMQEQINAFGEGGAVAKAAVHANPIERRFNKGHEQTDIEKGGEAEEKENRVSMSLQKAAVLEILDQACFAKGYDQEFGKACTDFEALGTLTPNVIKRIKDEFGYEIVK